MAHPTDQERFWRAKLNNLASTDDEKAKAAEQLEKIQSRHHRSEAAIRKRASRARKKAQQADPIPEFNDEEGYPAFWEKMAAWKLRHPEKAEAPKKIEQPKPAPVVVAPIIAPAPVKVAPRPVPAPKPAPVVVRKAREGHSGFFFDENYWNLDADERRGRNIVMNANPALKDEFEHIQTAMREERQVQKLPTEAEKAAAFTAPLVRPDALSTGQPVTVDAIRKTFGPTLGEPDAAGVTPELDRRSWTTLRQDEER